MEDGSVEQVGMNRFIPEPTYDAPDYLHLPDGGTRHFNLADAALLAALDIWTADGNPEFPVGDFDTHYPCDEPQVRAGIRPMQQRLLATLVKAVESNQLEASVFGRDVRTSRLIPERTYVDRGALFECLESYGFPRGEVIGVLEEEEAEGYWETASSVAYERAQFRHGASADTVIAEAGLRTEQGIDEVSILKNLLVQQRVHLAELSKQLTGSSTTVSERPLSARERNTLHVVVAVLLEQIGTKQEAVIADITSKHPSTPGLSRRTLETVFARARKAMGQQI